MHSICEVKLTNKLEIKFKSKIQIDNKRKRRRKENRVGETCTFGPDAGGPQISHRVTIPCLSGPTGRIEFFTRARVGSLLRGPGCQPFLPRLQSPPCGPKWSAFFLVRLHPQTAQRKSQDFPTKRNSLVSRGRCNWIRICRRDWVPKIRAPLIIRLGPHRAV